ncbi:hypothetical protein MNBD_ALPHA01-1688 [hydrothermal vent metagenome]|uniref:Acyltransferase 3 domain-containing protein n=1 Tax=hydrothermal vent metagenome TaxID=652676 RepID=A0A3B0RP22_9ZZZZ
MARNHSLDNAKFILILLVVFGHMIEPYIEENRAFKVIYLFLYSFHMPAFVLVSGMLSKAVLDEGATDRLVRTILVPFIIFTLFYESVYFLENGHLSKYIKGLQPYWVLWFFLSLFVWRLLLPVVVKFRHPVVFLIMVSLLAGYFDSIGRFMGISRTIYFFPFFVVGYLMTADVLSNLKLNKIPKVIFLAVLGLNIALFSYFHEMSEDWLLGATSYFDYDVQVWSAGLIRFALYCLSFLTVMSFLFLVPKGAGFLSRKGENSLQAYVWHPIFITVITLSGLSQNTMQLSGPLALIIFFVTAFVLSAMLSSNFVMSATQRFLISPAIHFLTILRPRK